MGNELEKAGQNLPAVLNEEDYGYGDEISSEGLQIPLVKLCQNATRERPSGVGPGDFYNASTGKNYGKELTTHVFKSYRGRLKFTPDYRLECKSDDGVTGSVYGKCAACQFSSWKDNAEDRKTKYCAPVVTFLVVPEGEIIPGLLSLSKVRETAANKVNSQLKFLVMENKTQPQEKRIPICFYKIKLTSFVQDYNDNQIYNVKPELVGYEKDSERQAILIGLFREWKTYVNDISKVSGEETKEAQPEEPKESKSF